MFFVISKVLGFVATPSNTIAALFALGVVLLGAGRRGAGVKLLATATVLLLVIGYSPLGNIMLLGLSERFPAWHATGSDPDGIIVLGGAIETELSAARGTVEVGESAERIFAMLDLARRFPKARIVFTGGSGNLIANSAPEAPIAGRVLDQFGIAPERVTLEARSRTTDENARFTRALVTPKQGERWLLVTSAYHMPRAIAAFRAAGFDVEAYPVDWRTRGWGDAVTPFDRLSAGLEMVDIAVHEWTGLVAYRLAGKSRELLPGPRGATPALVD